MGKYVTISVKVPKEVKEEMVRLGIKPSKLLRKAIEEEIRRRKVQELKEEIERLKPVLEKIRMEDVVKGIREDRERN